MMNKNILLFLGIGLLASCAQYDSKQIASDESQKTGITYPDTKKGQVVDTYFGTKVADPYRWLEDDMSTETAQWVKAENQVTQQYLKNIPYREQIEDRLTQLWNYEKVTAPITEGEYTYFYKNNGLQNQYVMYRKKGDAEIETFLDPNTFSKDGTVSLGQVSFSKDSSIVAYAISEGGSDWRKVKIINVESKKQIE
jgi:prolyl oligopeptidase